MEIQQAKVRDKLRPRREPFWRQIERGFYIGYRKIAAGDGTKGTWIARWRDPDTGKQRYRPLGSVASCTYADASAEAVKWHQQCQQGVVKAESVKAALGANVDDRRQCKGAATAADANSYFDSLICGVDAPAWGRSFGNIRLDRLRVADVRKFRDSLIAGNARSKATANRIMRRVKAGLNWAFKNQLAPSDTAWRNVPMFPSADGQRSIHLTLDQRRLLLEKCSPALSDFLVAMLHTAARPNEIAAAKVSDFDRKQKTLRLVSHKGRDGVPRVRHADLTDDAASLFERHSRLRHKALPLMTDAAGNAWRKHTWGKQLRDAVLAANLPSDIVAYTFRHCAITDWMRAGMNVGDVAKQAGTSIVMISRTYYQAGDTRVIREGIPVV